MYSEKYQDVKDRMLNNLTYDIDKREGSFINDMYSPTSLEFERAYEDMDELHSILFIADSEGLDLTKKTSEFGVDRKPGESASGVLTFKGTDGILIPRFMKIATDGGYEYVTTSQGYIVDGSIDITVKSVDVGEIYNIEANAVWNIPSEVNVNEIVNNEAFNGGIDIESDDDLKRRFFETVQNKRTSGNKNDYVFWAKEITGVYNAECYPLWNGNGTVKVVASGESRLPLSEDVLYNCNAHIQDMRPVGATVTVATTNILDVVVNATISIDETYSGDKVLFEVENAVKEYIESCVDKIYYNKLGARILSCAGVIDYNALTINGASTPIISIGIEQVARLSNVNIFLEGQLSTYKYIGGSRSVWNNDVDQLIKEVRELRLNTLTLSCKFNIPDKNDTSVSIDETDLSMCSNIINRLSQDNMLDSLNIIFEPYPYIANGSIGETEFAPSDETVFLNNWKQSIILALDTLPEVNYWAIYCNSNIDKLMNNISAWNDIYATLKGKYPTSNIMVRTNYWYTKEDNEYGYGLNTRKTHDYYKIWDMLAIACYFELGSETGTPSASVDDIKNWLVNGTIMWNRGQKIVSEIEELSIATGKDIFLGELGCPSLENAISYPYNNACGTKEDQTTQKNLFQAYSECFMDKSWFKGWSAYCIGDSANSPFNVYGKESGAYISSLNAINLPRGGLNE